MGLATTTIIAILVSLVAIPLSCLLKIHRNDPYSHSKSFDKDTIARLSTDKVILITGANSGLGLSTAMHLAGAGTARKIILTCRNLKKCYEAKRKLNEGVDIDVAQLDLSSLESIKLFPEKISPLLPDNKLDILINNAGIMAVPHSIVGDTGVEIHMHVNHLGHFALTSLLFPHLEAAGGRVVSVSSITASLPINLDDMNLEKSWYWNHFPTLQSIVAYGASKRANLAFTSGFNRRFATRGVTAVAAHPGYSRTELMMNGWDFAPDWLRRFMTSNTVGSMGGDEGCLSQLRAALDIETVQCGDYVGPLWIGTGRPVVIGTVERSACHWPISDGLVESLWRFSEDAIGWKFE